MADVVRLYGDEFRRTHHLHPLCQAVLNALQNCRTEILGGHVDQCDLCDHQHISYNSCRNRHCPKCQGIDMVRWVKERESELLPVQYFHIVFTLPHELNWLAQYDPVCVYRLLFQAATETLQTFADKRWGGKLGITCVLHTWGQKMEQHIHLHTIVTGGVLTHDGERWINAPKNYLFKVENLSKVFRAKFCDKLQKAYKDDEACHIAQALRSTETLADKVQRVITTLRDKSWVVYCKPPFAGPEVVLKYLSRYTHRIAISNRRLLSIDKGKIKFSWKDYKDDCKEKTMELSADEFIRRFLLHVLPRGFVRIRHFGLLAGRNRNAKLNRCRALFGLPARAPKERLSSLDILRELSDSDPTLCPVCGKGHMVFQRDLFSRLTNHDPPARAA